MGLQVIIIIEPQTALNQYAKYTRYGLYDDNLSQSYNYY